ncbi:TonB-dependent receptor [Terracidiphilus gabretensis]|jgi:vitamin B12 transporter|uniref:TonB-dependent receptor n=1 Tax=Terracidiphilus gabretensis TaxID=1577687 RepID=UPI00071C03BD|nr:TonB-dependent receptor plug domain-containing protein [Terracidiphilus gabretensis]
MSISFLRGPFFHRALPVLAILLAAVSARAASVRGRVTDSSGARVSNAAVALLQGGKIVTNTLTGADGSFTLTTGKSGRFFLVVSAKSFRQLETPTFYAGSLDSIERSIVLEPQWVRQSIVVTATGTPTPQPQTSSATNVLGQTEIGQSSDFTSLLRLMPGTASVQIGQRGAQSALFIRGGDSDNNKVLIDGISAGDLGGRFDFGPLSTTGIERSEIYRGPNSDLYGAGAESGVVSFITPRGTTSFPSIFVSADAGNFYTSREEAQLAGAHDKVDYFAAYSWLQTANDLPNDEHHLGSAAGNFGYQFNDTTQLRGTVHYNVASTGVPNAWDFYHVTDVATQKDQDLYISATFDNQTTESFHNTIRYGATRKREQFSLWQNSGELIEDYDGFGDDAYFGQTVTINGANGSSATGRAIIDYPGTYSEQLVSNRDQLLYQGDFRFTPHLVALIGFHYEDERGSEVLAAYGTNDHLAPTNYDYLASVHGDFKNRFFYNLGGSLEHYALFGTYTTPRAGFTFYALKPRRGAFSGTRILFNYGDGIREPALTDEFSSLYTALVGNGYASVAKQLNIGPLAPPTQRMYEGGVEQTFFSQHILFRASYFHNEFGRQIESVSAVSLPDILGFTGQARQDFINALGFYYTLDYGLNVNTQAFHAQGIESTVEGGIGRSIFLRAGYTWMQAQVQRSFDSDNLALVSGFEPTYNGIPIGAYSPLVGARPFRRPPNSAFATATYSNKRLSAILTSAFASRSDDSTYLAYADQTGGNSLLLPNRNLDHGYAKLDLGGIYQLINWLSVYAQAENLANSQHIAPLGYPSLPFNLRAGLRFQWGKDSAK